MSARYGSGERGQASRRQEQWTRYNVEVFDVDKVQSKAGDSVPEQG